MPEKDGLDHLKSELYSREAGPEVDPVKRSPLSPSSTFSHSLDGIRRRGEGQTHGRIIQGKTVGGEEDVFSEESAPPPMRKKTRTSRSFAPYFLWGSLVFFILAALVASFALLGGGNTISPQNIDLEIVAPALVDSGKPTTIQYIINNRNSATLLAADMVISYPNGTRSATETSSELPRERLALDNIQAEQQVKKTSTALFFGEEGTQSKISITLEYQIAGSNAIFVKQAEAIFTIGSSPVSLPIDAPKEAISGQEFQMYLTVQSNATTPITDVALQAQYPFGYVLSGSTPKAEAGTFWRIGTLEPGESKVVRLTGVLTGEDGDERVFHFLVGSQPDQTATKIPLPLLSAPQTITVKKPFVSAAISINGQSGSTVAAPLGKVIQGQIRWQNNLPDPISNMTLSLSFQGAALDQQSINAGRGFYDSSKNAIVWTSLQDPSLASVPPGATAQYDFSFSTVSGTTLTNPSIALNLTARATRSTNTNVPENISSAASLSVNLASAVSLSTQALYATGPYTNTGPLPPKVNQKTTYSILWSLKNSSNTIAGSAVRAVLPTYVEFVQAQTLGEKIQYDAASRTVTWSIDDLRPGVGYSLPARQAAFQVVLTPSLSQINQAPALTGDTLFTGQDRYAKSNISVSTPAPTTVLSETGFSDGMGVVSQ